MISIRDILIETVFTAILQAYRFVLAVSVLWLTCCGPSPSDRVETAEKFDTNLVQATEPVLEFPESVVWDKTNSVWYVSNFGGTIFADDSGMAPTKADANGFISRLTSDGEIDTVKWIIGLHAPKGLGIYAGKLYAADVGQVVIMDIAEAKITRRIMVPDSQFLNGLAVDSSNGDIYISDMMRNQILRLSQGSDKTEVFLESAELEMPNGLYVDGNILVVGGWGVITDPATLGTDVKGRIKLVNLETKKIDHVRNDPTANIDGIIKHGSDYILTDWIGGELIKVSADGSMTTLQSGYKNSADIGFDPERKAVAIPEMTSTGEPGKVSFFILE